MTKRFGAIFILTLSLFMTPGWTSPADAATAKDVVSALEQGYGTMSDLQAEFSQTTHIASMGRNEKGGGELFLKKSGKSPMFRFNYTKPKQQIVSNGKKVWYYLPENRQVVVTDVASLYEGGTGMGLNYLTGMGNLSADFSATLAGPEKKGTYLLNLVPKKKNPSLAKLQLVVSAKAVDDFLAAGKAAEAFPVLASVVYDQMGNRTRIDYSKIRINRGIGADRFSFKVPEGVEVISQ